LCFILNIVQKRDITNLIAGILLSLTRVIKIGQEITVLNSSGKVIEISPIYAILDTGEHTILVPNVAILTNAVKRQKNTIKLPE